MSLGISARVTRPKPTDLLLHPAHVSRITELRGTQGQLLVLLLGNVSLQDGVRLVDVALPARLADALPGPRLGIAGVRALVGEPDRALLATALKPVGLTPQQLASLAYEIAAGGLHIVKEGVRAIYLPCVNGSAAGFSEQLRLARREGAHGVMVLPGVAGFGALAHAAEVFDGGMILSHPSFLGGFTASPSHGIAPHVLFGTLLRLAGADATIFPSFGGRFSLSREQCLCIAEAARRPLHGVAPTLPVPGGMSIDRVPELLDAYGSDTVFLVGADLQRGRQSPPPRRTAARSSG